jgi:transcription-repair coupling factor (superfamily II helicase)
LRDRFGPLPSEVEALMHVARVRERAKLLGARNVTFEDQTRSLRILMPQESEAFYYQNTFPKVLDRFELIGKQNIRLVSEKKMLRLVIRLQTKEDGEARMREIEEVLAKLTPGEAEAHVPSVTLRELA